MEAVFVLDIILNFFTAYNDTEDFHLETHLKYIAIHYMTKGTFVIDLITVWPFALNYYYESIVLFPES